MFSLSAEPLRTHKGNSSGGGAGGFKPSPLRIFESEETILPKNTKRYHDGDDSENIIYNQM